MLAHSSRSARIAQHSLTTLPGKRTQPETHNQPTSRRCVVFSKKDIAPSTTMSSKRQYRCVLNLPARATLVPSTRFQLLRESQKDMRPNKKDLVPVLQQHCGALKNVVARVLRQREAFVTFLHPPPPRHKRRIHGAWNTEQQTENHHSKFPLHST